MFQVVPSYRAIPRMQACSRRLWSTPTSTPGSSWQDLSTQRQSPLAPPSGPARAKCGASTSTTLIDGRGCARPRRTRRSPSARWVTHLHGEQPVIGVVVQASTCKPSSPTSTSHRVQQGESSWQRPACAPLGSDNVEAFRMGGELGRHRSWRPRPLPRPAPHAHRRAAPPTRTRRSQFPFLRLHHRRVPTEFQRESDLMEHMHPERHGNSADQHPTMWPASRGAGRSSVARRISGPRYSRAAHGMWAQQLSRHTSSARRAAQLEEISRNGQSPGDEIRMLSTRLSSQHAEFRHRRSGGCSGKKRQNDP